MSFGNSVPPFQGPGGIGIAGLVPPWAASTTYAQGAMVIPTADVPTPAPPLPDPYFDSGAFAPNWTPNAWTLSTGTNPLNGGNNASLAAGAGSGIDLVCTTMFPVVPGQVMTAGLYSDTQTTDFTQSTCVYISILWYNSSHVFLSQTAITDSSSSSFFLTSGFPPPGQTKPAYYLCQVVGTAPVGAAYATLEAVGKNVSASSTVNVLGFGWIYATPGSVANPKIYTAIQIGSGTSASTEPAWPSTGTIFDGTVEWEEGIQQIITWQTIVPNQSGTSEPTWPTTPGSQVFDGTLYWQCVTPAVTDTNCPQTKFVVAASSKIYAGDNDIVRFSATTNPMDWTTQADAGFLPTGLQSYGANPVTAMGLYRSNLVVFNSQGLQMWQIDEDPANMSLLDAIPIGSTYSKALAPVNNDLFFLSPQGVRTMGISAAAGNLSAGDVGMPIDPIIQAALVWANANSVEPLATYYPSAGQYWLAFPGWPDSGFFMTGGSASTTDVFVYTMNRTGEVGAWSRYLFPFVIEAFCQNGNDMYIRANTGGNSDILKVDSTALQDYASDTHGRTANFTGVVQWPWLDFGQPGITKKLDGIDIVSNQNSNITVQVGFDQSNTSAYTTSFTVPGDSVPGTMIPVPCLAPSFSVRLVLPSSEQWQVQAVNVYLQDQRVTA